MQTSTYETVPPSAAVIQELSPVLQYSNSFFIARLPIPPGTNASYEIGVVRQKNKKLSRRIIATDALMEFKEHAAWELKRSTCDWHLVEAIRASKQHVPLFMKIRFYYPTMWKHDIDAGEKAVIDAVFFSIKLNDNLICQKITTKDVDRADPHVEVELRCILSGR